MNSRKILNTLRNWGLSKPIDHLRYQWILWKTRKTRVQFRAENPDVVLPPDYYMYETFALDYHQYYYASEEAARFWAEMFGQYKDLEQAHVLDWGCGPGRVIRHMPKFLPQTAQCYGCDYNADYIHWCSKHLKGIDFASHGVNPPLPYANESMDLIYGISIFTHLSEAGHNAWRNELMRVLKPQGVLCITLHGDVFINRLNEEQKANYQADKLVTVGNTMEGHRTYIAFHPPAYVSSWLADFTLLKHVPGTLKNGKPQQDIWLFQKP